MNLDVRNAWLDYYQAKGFRKNSSAPLIHPLFPTSFNMSAGIVQLDAQIRSPKKIRPYKDYLVQKCFRHFDIVKVGDNRHLSFFEMAAAFEVGEFCQEKNIADIRFFLTDILGVDPNKLWITTFIKDTIADKQISLTKKLLAFIANIGRQQIFYGNKDTNFWLQGGGANLTDNIKLCGPQIEFYYDLGKNIGCRRKNCQLLDNCGRFLEVANSILIQYYIDYNQKPILKKLINPAIETVIGLERVAMILENRSDVFETSYLQPLASILPMRLNEEVKIITDHIKGLVFIYTEEKILPGKNMRNRIVRTLIRNLLTSFYILHLDPQQYLPLLIDKVIETYKDIYPETHQAKISLLPIILEHEKIYKQTLERGMKQIKIHLEKNKIKRVGEKEKELFRLKFGVPAKYISVFLGSRLPTITCAQ